MADFLHPSTVPIAPAVEAMEEWPYTAPRQPAGARLRVLKREPVDDSDSEDPEQEQDQEKHQLDLDA